MLGQPVKRQDSGRVLLVAALLLAASAPAACAQPTNRISIAEAEAVVARAYEDILHRPPDPAGLKTHARALVEEGRTEEWLRRALADSPEAQGKRRRLQGRLRAAAVCLVSCGALTAGSVWLVFRLARGRAVRVVLVNLVATLFGAAAVVAFFEWDLRSRHGAYDFFDAGVENPDFRQGREDVPKVFTEDPDMGFRPVCGPGQYYSEFGTVAGVYGLDKRPGVTRLLFIGDSVTHRGQIIGALREKYGGQRYEYWNAGVESFNTVQEAAFYRKFNRGIRPDHVILTATFNDLETTPLVYRSGGRLVLVSPLLPRSEINGWLFRHSYLYRQYVGRKVKRGQAQFTTRIRTDTLESLQSLGRELAAEGIRFTVLVLPPLLDLSAPVAKDAAELHAELLSIMSRADVTYHDLAVPVAEALRAGVTLGESPGDIVHPSPELCRHIADYLAARNAL